MWLADSNRVDFWESAIFKLVSGLTLLRSINQTWSEIKTGTTFCFIAQKSHIFSAICLLLRQLKHRNCGTSGSALIQVAFSCMRTLSIQTAFNYRVTLALFNTALLRVKCTHLTRPDPLLPLLNSAHILYSKEHCIWSKLHFVYMFLVFTQWVSSKITLQRQWMCTQSVLC